MIFFYFTLIIFAAFVTFQTLYIIIPLFKNEGKHKKRIRKRHSFSIIVPSFNEEKVIMHCVSGFQQLIYKRAELLIINDGSTDKTLPLLRSKLKLKKYYDKSSCSKFNHQKVFGIYKSRRFPKIFVIDKLNGGKADALNAGINYSANEIIITLDADSVLDQNALREMNAAFQKKEILACGGNVLIAQGFKGDINNLTPMFTMKGIIRYQFLQYLTAFYLHKRAQSTLSAITVIAGAFGAFRKDTLFQINGFRQTVGEDMDITLKLHKWIKENGRNEKITFVPTAVCYTECPNNIKNLFRQRVRWQKAFIDCLIHYRKCFFREFSYRFSLFFLLDQFIIGTMSAFLVIATPLLFVFFKGHFLLLMMFVAGAVILLMYQSITTIYISSLHGITFSKPDIVRILLFLPIEILVFRMINLCFVIYGTLTYFHNSQSWDKVERSGDLEKLKVNSV